MLYFSLTKKILITIFCLFLALLALPNFTNISSNIPLLPNNTLNLGLDLRGGSYLLLEVDTETIKREKSEFLLDDIRSNLRKNRIKYSNLKLLEDGVSVFIVEQNDINNAKRLIENLDQGNNNLFLNQSVSELEVDSDSNYFLLVVFRWYVSESSRPI